MLITDLNTSLSMESAVITILDSLNLSSLVIQTVSSGVTIDIFECSFCSTSSGNVISTVSSVLGVSREVSLDTPSLGETDTTSSTSLYLSVAFTSVSTLVGVSKERLSCAGTISITC